MQLKDLLSGPNKWEILAEVKLAEVKLAEVASSAVSLSVLCPASWLVSD